MKKVNIDVLPVFIGYDSREPEAYEVCKHSLLKHSSIALHIQKLDERMLRYMGVYKRKWYAEGNQKYDVTDGKPFSTEFSFTRFLVPAMCQYEGYAVFMDCDQLMMVDIEKLIHEIDPKKAVQVCKQAQNITSDVKMDGQKQEKTYRKNWSAFMVYNCGHPSARNLTVEAVNNEPGAWLHGFGWCPDSDIGKLDNRWNWIAGTTSGEPYNVHYTSGGPWFPHMRYGTEPYFDDWRKAAREIGVWKQLENAA